MFRQVFAVNLAHFGSDIAHVVVELGVPKEEVAEDAAVGVGAVNRVVPLQVVDVFHEVVHYVVLRLHVHQRVVVHLHVEIAENPLQQQESEEILVLPARGVIEHPNTLLRHLVISHIEQARIKDRSIHIQNLNPAISSLELSKMLFSQINQLFMLNITSTNNNHILPIIHPLMILYNHISAYLMNIFNLTKNGQTHLMVPINVKVNILH